MTDAPFTRIHWSRLAFLPAVAWLAFGLACGGSGGSSSTPTTPAAPTTPTTPTTPTPPPPPPPVPVPEGLRVLAIGSSFIEFEWNSVEGATRYEIQLSLNASSFEFATSRLVSSGTTHRFEVSPETTGYARVRAEMDGRWSEYSGSVTGRSLPPPPLNLRVISTGSEFIEFEWDPVDDVISYDIEMSLRRGDFTNAQSATTTDTTHSFTITPDTEGFARVRATWTAGRSDWSGIERGLSDPAPASCGAAARNLLIEIGPTLFGSSSGPSSWVPGTHMRTWDYVTVDGAECVTRLDFRDVSSVFGSGVFDVRGTIPPELGRLRRLKELYLGHDWQDEMDSSGYYCRDRACNGLSVRGEIPSELGQLTELRVLYIQSSGISGGIPAEIGQLTELRELGITETRVSGRIPPELGQLNNLTHLFLFYRQDRRPRDFRSGRDHRGNITGEIPEEIGDLRNLRVLDLSYNQLGQQIPDEIGNLTRMQVLQLSQNDLERAIPSAIGNMTQLQSLDLHWNDLTDRIPSSLGQLSSLLRLNLTHNDLSGCIPPRLAEIDAVASGSSIFFSHPVNPQQGGLELPLCGS